MNTHARVLTRYALPLHVKQINLRVRHGMRLAYRMGPTGLHACRLVRERDGRRCHHIHPIKGLFGYFQSIWIEGD